MKKILIVLLSAALLFGLVGCADSNFENTKFNSIQSVYDEFSLSRISEIKVINGNNGERINLTAKEQIKKIYDSFSKLSIKDMEQPKEDSGGYTYSIGFYSDSERVLGIVYGSVTDTLLINRHLYTVEDMNVIHSAIDYFDEVLQ